MESSEGQEHDSNEINTATPQVAQNSENGNNTDNNNTTTHNDKDSTDTTSKPQEETNTENPEEKLSISGLILAKEDSVVAPGTPTQGGPKKKSVDDFVLGQVLGEGAYGAVVLGTDKDTNVQYAIKILEKKHIMKENKIKYVKTERDILCMCSHPNVVKLYYTFKSDSSLFYVLELCPNGELLTSIRKLGSFDEECIRFYAAELITVLEYLHSKGVVHRDLKPENILMSADWHIKLTDFGTAAQLGEEKNARSGSFVGTPEYMSPELINSRACAGSDLWALGVIIYQMYTNRLPFQGKTNFLTFQKVNTRDIIYPKDFPPVAKDLIEHLLVIEPDARLGVREGGYSELKAHPFFTGVDWENLHTQTPPPLRKLPTPLTFEEEIVTNTPPLSPMLAPKNPLSGTPANREEAKKWSRFLQPEEGIIFSGVVLKRKGFSIKKRRLLLTDTPRLIYIDEKKMEMKGEIPWSDQLRPELKNNSNFWIHTPKRKYILEDASNTAGQWVDLIQKSLERSQKII